MIKTGQTVNIRLGHGDSGKFDLLGGSFGEAGDVLFNMFGFGRRTFLKPPGAMKFYRSTSSPVGGGTGGGVGGGDKIEPRPPTYEK